jgi:hypothetical protein
VSEAYHAIPLPAWLNSRARELWKPLLALAAVADAENGLAVTPDLLALARRHVQDRDVLSAEAEALLAELGARLDGVDAVIVHPGDLTERLRERLGWKEKPTPQAVGGWLRRLGFERAGKDRDGAKYPVTARQLADVTARYAPADDGNWS